VETKDLRLLFVIGRVRYSQSSLDKQLHAQRAQPAAETEYVSPGAIAAKWLFPQEKAAFNNLW
jgi:hypothetical protein